MSDEPTRVYTHLFFPAYPTYILWGSEDNIHWKIIKEVQNLIEIDFIDNDSLNHKYIMVTGGKLCSGPRRQE